MRARYFILGGVALCAIAGTATVLMQSNGNTRGRGLNTPTVVAAPAQQQDVPVFVTGIGTAQASGTVDVHAQITGTIGKIGFTEGQTVHAGDLIAEIDPRPYQAALEQADAALARDQAQLSNTQRNLERYLSLGEKGFASTQQIETQRSSVDQLEAQVKSDTAAISKARTDLSYTHITAPIDGVTGLRGIDAGNIVHSADTKALVTITQIEPISVVFSLPAQHLAAVQAGMAQGALEADAFDQDDKFALGQGTLTVVDNQVDPKTGGVRMKAVFPNKDHKLWPGAFVNVRLETAVKKDAVTIPSVAVQHGLDGVFVYVLKSDNTVEHRAVTVSETNSDTTLVETGLKPGEHVISDGYARLSDGAKVKVTLGNTASTASEGN